MATPAPTVALIHASEASMAPAAQAFADEFPEARLWHLLDNRLVTDADAAGGLTAALHDRMSRLIQYAVDGGADAVQLSCSMYGPVAADAAQHQTVTVLASDQAMFEDIAARKPARIGLLGSLSSAVDDSARRLKAALSEAGTHATITGRVVHGASDAASRNDMDALVDLMAAAAQDLAPTVDLVVLVQYSLAPTAPALNRTVSVPVISPPHLAASTLAARLGGTD